MPYADKQNRKRYDAERYRHMPAEKKRRRRDVVARWRRDNRDKVNEYNRAYRKCKMRDYFRKYKAEQRKEPQHLMCKRLRNRMHKLLAGTVKSATTMELIGCSREKLIAHLEARFQPGMSWAERRRIHIDHVVPCASFDLTDPEQQRACFHYTNLQPLWASDNLSKGKRYE